MPIARGRPRYQGQPNQGLLANAGVEDIAPAALLKEGIPGIRFFDGNSRSAGEGTRNIVVFNPDDIKSVKRDGELVHKAK